MPTFPSGLIVYFRLLDANNRLVSSPHFEGRDVIVGADYSDTPKGYFKVVNDKGELLGLYAEEWVSCILPIQTVGPASDANPEK